MSTHAFPNYTSGKKGLIETVSSSLAELYRRRWLAVYFARRELFSSYRHSHLGFLWALLSPLLQITVLTLLFSEILGIRFREVTGDSSLNFGLFLFCGLIPFNAFSEALTKSTNSVRSNGALVEKVVFPLEILPLTKAIVILLNNLFAVGMLILVVAFVTHRLEWTILLLPLLIVLQLPFTLGLSYLFAVIGTYMPDVREGLRSFVRAMFFLTPIVWPSGRVPASMSWVVDYNPVAFLVNAYRDLVLQGELPDLLAAFWFSIFAGALCVAGFVLFVRVKQNFPDLI